VVIFLLYDKALQLVPVGAVVLIIPEGILTCPGWTDRRRQQTGQQQQSLGRGIDLQVLFSMTKAFQFRRITNRLNWNAFFRIGKGLSHHHLADGPLSFFSKNPSSPYHLFGNLTIFAKGLIQIRNYEKINLRIGIVVCHVDGECAT
jgi:hypothetical protein